MASNVSDFGKDVRIMFYGVTPSDTAQPSPEYFTKAIPYFFLMMAIECGVSLAKGKNSYRFNDASVSTMLGSIQILFGYWIKGLGMASYVWIYENVRLVDLDQTSWGAWLIALLMVDLGYYWMHRSAHEFHVLWSAHSVHHSGEDYNLATALRQGTLQSVYSWLFKMHTALFISPLVFTHHSALNTLYQFWIHTTQVGDLGILEYVLNTPSHHRMHHRPPGNCNYAGVLIIWDVMFGTFVKEDQQMDYYGLAKQYSTFDPFWANLEHLRRMQAHTNETSRGLGFYLRLLFKRRVKHRWVFRPQDLLKKHPTPKRSLWEKPLPNKRTRLDGDSTAKQTPLRLYTYFLYACGFFFVVSALLQSKYLQAKDAVVAQFVCVFIFSCMGRLLDGFGKGKGINTLRVLAFLCLTSALTAFPVALPPFKENMVLAFRAFTVLDAGVWSCIYTAMNKQLNDKVAKATKKDE